MPSQPLNLRTPGPTPLPPEVREAAWNAVTEAARQYAGDNGRIILSNKALLASGTA